MKTRFLTLMLVLLSASAMAQPYYQLSSGNPLNGNPYYILPKAAIVIAIPVTTQSYIGSSTLIADYSDDEQKILALKYGFDADIYKILIKKAERKFEKSSIGNDSVKVALIAKPDYAKVFFTDAEKKWNKNKSVSFTYGSDGIVTDGESFTEDKTFDLVVKTFSSVVSIAAAVFKGPEETLAATPRVTFDDLDEIKTKMDALDHIINNDIYKDRKSILQGKYDKAFAEHFYKEKKTIKITKLYYTPKAESVPADNQYQTLFSLNPDNGKLTFNKELSQELWAVNIFTAELDPKESFKIKFTSHPQTLQNAIGRSSFPSNGFAYNIPSQKEFKLVDKKEETIYDDFIKIPQWGIVGRLNTEKNKLTFSLDPVTGELKKVVIGSSAISSDQIGGVTSGLTDAVKFARGDSKDTEREKEAKRLETEVKIRDLQKSLDQQ
ncbi:hypothetical protein DIU31_023320 [Mucilaginibacter rubeus]|uniref:DUF4831 family protein n=1 Tax=Mucilaginibacter rubeus TaxID=2027860 RepID=A0AAE6MK36_9SPHI|nr:MULTISPECIES: hypothetical protein [Mucilaginibacter]QEM06306.1 hypothetical protein DIU31_023320 [Mucilaginibacter rubeus]QEM18889.1 hypothetical protein DIU38_023560 [Mucilaginibacter gossypii]QTE44568.1 hypothetical protein J3L19_04160 [Mucilaginibacter rubeus]QTE51166.1 hypothetical protein J3L21_04135 [Mucilaginibacter rubeus]QTE56254.1 hypothetical protein J3L23_29385 [Mucilaginibacter rubeus]